MVGPTHEEVAWDGPLKQSFGDGQGGLNCRIDFSFAILTPGSCFGVTLCPKSSLRRDWGEGAARDLVKCNMRYYVKGGVHLLNVYIYIYIYIYIHVYSIHIHK